MSASLPGRIRHRLGLGGRLAPRATLAGLVLVALAGGCKRGPADGPPCGAVGARFYALAQDDLQRAQPSDAVRRAIKDQLPAMRDALVNACTDGAWAGPVRACLVAASDRTGFEACERQLTDAQRAALDRAATATP